MKLKLQQKLRSRNVILALTLLFTFSCTIYLSPPGVYMPVYYFFHPHESISCYRLNRPSLQDILDSHPKKGKSIFFHETSCSSQEAGKVVISARQACAVESAARMNPNFEVYLLFTSPGAIVNNNSTSDRILKALMNYKNIKLRHLNYEEYVKSSPVEDLYRDGKIDNSKYARSHASDVLRYLTLWKYGGIYLDLDVVMIKTLEDVPPNYAGQESDENVAAGVLSFDYINFGHRLAKECLDDLRENFDGEKWGANGPGVITRLLRRICGVQRAAQMINTKCQGFTVYPKTAFYPVPWWKWKMYFDEGSTSRVFNLSKESFACHVWNKHSIDSRIVRGSKVPYALLAEQYCPTVYEESGQYF